MPDPTPTATASTGLPELDMILRGGFSRHRLHLVDGAPGTGKTTLALSFLRGGAARGERCLYVTLSESAEELATAAASHGWTLDGIEVFELVPLEAQLARQQTVLFPSEVELGETVRAIIERVERANPARLVIDSLAELRLLATDALRFRRQILLLKQFLQGRACTTLVLDDLTDEPGSRDLHSIVHGVISLQLRERTYGLSRRQLRVAKMRGSSFQSGWHDFLIETGELRVFPSLVADEHKRDFVRDDLPSGLPELDALVGGLSYGTTTMLIGPSGSGKSSLALLYATAAARRGECAAYFSFDEGLDTLAQRGERLSLPVAAQIEAGRLVFQRGIPSRLSPGEFAWCVRRAVEDQGARLVVIDSLNSYLGAMPEEVALALQMHELLTYLGNQGVVTILTLAQQGVVGNVQNPMDLSFLSDTILLLRFFEVAGEVRKSISVIKKRTGRHELAIREYSLYPHGIRVGPRLRDFHGVLTGVPTYTGTAEPLLRGAGDESN